MNDAEVSILYGVVSLSGTVLNIFLIFCMLFPLNDQRESLQQPLKLLLAFLVGYSTVLQASVMLSFFLFLFSVYSFKLQLSMSIVLSFSSCSVFSSSGWLSTFYYITIVPNQHTPFIWVKRNIKTIIYCGITVDRLLLLVAVVMNGAKDMLEESNAINYTSTLVNMTTSSGHNDNLHRFLEIFCALLYAMYFFIFFILLAWPHCATLRYLRRHVTNMEANSSQFSRPQLQSHFRITVVGIIQAGLYLPCCLWMIFDMFLYTQKCLYNFDKDEYIANSMVVVFSFGNTICLCFSQSLFKQRLIRLTKKVLEMFRCVKIN